MRIIYYYLFICILAINSSCSASISGNDRQEIEANEILKLISKGKDVFIYNKTIKGELDLTSSGNEVVENQSIVRKYIPVGITFINCFFEENLIASKMIEKNKHQARVICLFNRNVTFSKCQFNGIVNFTDVKIDNAANFEKSIFYKEANFEGLTLGNANTSFSECIFKGISKFQRINSLGNVSFLNTTFDNVANFQMSRIFGDLQFGASKINDRFLFELVNISGRSFFEYVQFDALSSFSYSKFGEGVTFVGAKFNAPVNFSECRFTEQAKFSSAFVKSKLAFDNAVFVGNLPDTVGLQIEDKANFKLDSAYIINATRINKLNLKQ
jgi:uncharacterized protein YjbI with pentapeptide repeats